MLVIRLAFGRSCDQVHLLPCFADLVRCAAPWVEEHAAGRTGNAVLHPATGSNAFHAGQDTGGTAVHCHTEKHALAQCRVLHTGLRTMSGSAACSIGHPIRAGPGLNPGATRSPARAVARWAGPRDGRSARAARSPQPSSRRASWASREIHRNARRSSLPGRCRAGWS